MKITKLIRSTYFFTLILLNFTLLQSISNMIFNFTNQNIIISALIQFLHVFICNRTIFFFNLFQKLFIFLFNTKNKTFKWLFYLVFLAVALQVYLWHTFCQDLLFSLLLNHHFAKNVHVVQKMLSQHLPWSPQWVYFVLFVDSSETALWTYQFVAL